LKTQKHQEDIENVELSESQKRMLMLHKEKELELQRDRIEAIAAGMQPVFVCVFVRFFFNFRFCLFFNFPNFYCTTK
jgi:hypothetical protein